MRTLIYALLANVAWLSLQSGLSALRVRDMSFSADANWVQSVYASPPSARWLWIRGSHASGPCQVHRPIFESKLKQSLRELAQIRLPDDDQKLSCTQMSCARARLISAGALNALLAKSRCIGADLKYTLYVISNQSKLKPHVYSVTLRAPQHTPTELRRAGIQLSLIHI